MKKRLLFCFLALVSSLTAFAMIGDKITDLSQLRNDMCYTILPQDNSRGTWVFNPDDPVRLYSTEKMGIEVNQSDPAQWFAFLKSKSGKYYVYNVQSDKFLCYGDGEVSLKSRLLDTTGVASIIPSTGSDRENYPWVVALNGHQLNLCNAGGLNGTYGVVFYNHSDDVGNCISISEGIDFNWSAHAMMKVDEFEALYTKENLEIVADANFYLSIPSTAVGCVDPELWNALNLACGGDRVADIYDLSDPKFQEALQNLKDAGFVKFESFSNDKVYQIVNMTTSNGYLNAREGSEYVFASSKSTNLSPVLKSGMWQLHQEDGKYYLYNQGKKAFVKFNPAANKWEFTSKPTVVNVEKHTVIGPMSVFWIQDADYTDQYQYMHINNTYETGVVGWELVSEATNFYFVEIPGAEVHPLTDLALTKAKIEAQAIIDSYDSSKGNYIGNYNREAIEALQKAINDENATTESINSALLEVENSRKPQVGKYYFILNTMSFDDGGVKAIYENPDGTNIAWHTTEGKASELWQFEPEDGENGRYSIKSVNTGKYITQDGAKFKMKPDGTTAFTMVPKAETYIFGLETFNGVNYTMSMSTTDAPYTYASKSATEGGYVVSYNDYAQDIPTQWNVIEADHVNVAIGETGYATAYFPFAVTIPAGVTAYTVAAAADGVATLSKLSGTIPAHTGVVLSGTANTPCTFEFAADAAAVDGNMLKGMTISTAVPAETKAYVLANGSKGVGFYRLSESDRTIAANKAYLIVDDAAAPSVFSLKLDGGLTGIEGVESAGGNAPAYDLQGRRLPQVPTKGLYIQNGKKVMSTPRSGGFLRSE